MFPKEEILQILLQVQSKVCVAALDSLNKSQDIDEVDQDYKSTNKLYVASTHITEAIKNIRES